MLSLIRCGVRIQLTLLITILCHKGGFQADTALLASAASCRPDSFVVALAGFMSIDTRQVTFRKDVLMRMRLCKVVVTRWTGNIGMPKELSSASQHSVAANSGNDPLSGFYHASVANSLALSSECHGGSDRF